MHHQYADDGRILTSPKELEPLLRGSFPAFYRTVGHVRFFYMADEIWDGESSLVFMAGGEQLAAITLGDGVFYIRVADSDFRIVDGALLGDVFAMLEKTVPMDWHRPFEQLTVSPDPNVYPCGYRCDLCLGSKRYSEHDYSESDNFAYMNWVCYHNCVPGIDIERPPAGDRGIFQCSGCNLNRNRFCRSFFCCKEKGYANCAECGQYHSCDVYHDSHHAAQCNLGITAEEVTRLVIPYCMKERLDVLRNSVLGFAPSASWDLRTAYKTRKKGLR
ncbi:MAG: DUF3795 domain-containing protein [Anaerolineae bacterium]|nr:DUF3795 domain-containing protein [Anaerolineae bacterium]